MGCKKADYSYSTNGISLKNYDNSGPFAIPASGAVEDSAYIIRVNYESDFAREVSVNDDYTYRGINALTGVEIRCFQNFDATHPANSIVNEYFIPGPGTGYTRLLSNP
jgi:hypothetical protein